MTFPEYIEHHGGWWGEDPQFPVEDWMQAVREDSIRGGYWTWAYTCYCDHYGLDSSNMEHKCPECKEPVYNAEVVEVFGDKATQRCSCPNGHGWVEVYTFTGIDKEEA